MSKLENLCNHFNIPIKKIDYSKYCHVTPTSNEIFDCMYHLCDLLGDDLIIYGGQSIHPKLLGYKHIRKVSNDIDCVISETGVEKIVEFFDQNKYYCVENRGDLFLDYCGLPVGLNLEYIHDWKITNEFKKDKIAFPIKNATINVASPEYTIMLKVRRAESNDRFFGKDKLDIANLMIASSVKNIDIDMKKTASLLKEHVTECSNTIFNWVEHISLALVHFNKKEQNLFLDKFSDFYSEIHIAYTN